MDATAIDPSRPDADRDAGDEACDPQGREPAAAREAQLARVARELSLSVPQVARTVALLDAGNTVPFITRYRKEQTGNLDEGQIRDVQRRMKSLRQVAERAGAILRLIEAQGKLTRELRGAIKAAESLKQLEDLYLPYRPKRRSRAEAARQRGLGPLAERVWSGAVAAHDLQTEAAVCVSAAQELPDSAAVLQGVSDILAERISEQADAREAARKVALRTGRLESAAVDETAEGAQAFRDYFHYSETVGRIPPHRVLALNRGEQEKALRVRLAWEAAAVQSAVEQPLGLGRHPCAEFLRASAADAIGRLLHPSLEREVRRDLTERAESHAVGVFARNLRNLLLQPPLRGERVLAIDPGLRTGCKVAVLDELGTPVHHDLVFVTGSPDRRVAARKKLAELARGYECRLVAIGNGTACRETEELVAEMIREQIPDARYVIVNEAGASVYSASPGAREEFPDLDATLRGTISIGRRLQDPLSELVKIAPQNLGVGMYQHDVEERALQESLDEVVESCVNFVGVDLNRASAALLRHVSGFNQLIARRVVEWREKHGRFARRGQLRDVPGIGDGIFTQAAGFLKVVDGDEPLDGTWIHPESYDAAGRVLSRLDVSAAQLCGGSPGPDILQRLEALDVPSLAGELDVGEPTLKDILEALKRPGRDPRVDLPGPLFKQGVLSLDDLTEGMELTGTVLNVVDFGAFVDVGLKDSGLVHISQLSTGYVRSPHDVVSLGDVVTVWVRGVDRERHRVSLTMVRPAGEGRSQKSEVRGQRSDVKGQKPEVTGQRSEVGSRKGACGSRIPHNGDSALTPEQQSGQAPLKGFDELKELWKGRG